MNEVTGAAAPEPPRRVRYSRPGSSLTTIDRYRPPLTERLGLEDPAAMRAVAWSLPFAALVAVIVLLTTWRLGPLVAFPAAVLAFGASSLVVSGCAWLIAHLSARAGGHLILPSGRSTPTAASQAAAHAARLLQTLAEPGRDA